MSETLSEQMAGIDVARLYVAAVDCTPRPVEWSAGGWDEDADEPDHQWWEAVECETCSAVVVDGSEHRARLVDEDGAPVLVDGREVWADEDEQTDHEDAGHVPDGGWWETCEHEDEDAGEMDAEGPMMSYYYPLPIRADELDGPDLARRLVNVELCPVLVGDVPGLALTGGGMDFSWSICAAFMLAGYLPPAHFTDLPDEGGRRADVATVQTLAACRRTLEIRARWAVDGVARLARLAADLAPVNGADLPTVAPLEVVE